MMGWKHLIGLATVIGVVLALAVLISPRKSGRVNWLASLGRGLLIFAMAITLFIAADPLFRMFDPGDEDALLIGGIAAILLSAIATRFLTVGRPPRTED
jgi:hypothetical protein